MMKTLHGPPIDSEYEKMKDEDDSAKILYMINQGLYLFMLISGLH